PFTRAAGLRAVGVDAGGKILVKEIRLGKAEVDLRARTGDHETEPQILSAAQQVTFANAHIADPSIGSPKAGAELQVARRLLFDSDIHDGSIRAAALNRLQIYFAEEAEILNPLPRAADF